MHTELCALSILGRLGRNNQRYCDVAGAHSHTFHWILKDEGESSIDARDEEQELGDYSKEPELKSDLKWRLLYENTQRIVNEKLKDWLVDGSGLFHISGKPGSGKSTLMKYLVKHPKVALSLQQWAHPKRLALGTFFFWKPDRGQNSLQAMIHGLLYSMIDFDASLVHSAFPKCSRCTFEQLSLQSRVEMTEADILEAFHNLVRDDIPSKLFKFCFFIDGLDEIDEERDTTHSKLVHLMQEWMNTSQGFVKICVSSRQFPVFNNMPVRYRIRLQDLTKYDMRKFVQHSLRSHHAFRSEMTVHPKACQSLVRVICNNSNGVFLWTSLVLKSVERGLSNGDSMVVLLDRAQRTPRQLKELFESLLETIEECHAQIALLILFIVMELDHPLEPGSFDISSPICQQVFRAMETAKPGDPDSVFHPNNPPEVFDWTREEEEKTKSQLAFLCKGLLEIRPWWTRTNDYNGYVTFLHRSIPDILRKRIPRHMAMHGVTDVYVHTAICWMLWADAEFTNSARYMGLDQLSDETQAYVRGGIRSRANAVMANLVKIRAPGAHLSTAFQLLDLTEDSLLTAKPLSTRDDGSVERVTWNTARVGDCESPEISHQSCPLHPLPLLAAFGTGCEEYVRWRLRTMPPSAPGDERIQHCLEAAFNPILPPEPPFGVWKPYHVQVIQILISDMGADVNRTLLPCCGAHLGTFDPWGAQPSVFDAFWMNTLMKPLHLIDTCHEKYFFMTELLLRLGAIPRSVLCIGAARDWFHISLHPSEIPESGEPEHVLGTGFWISGEKVTDEILRRICGQSDGIITLEKWVAFARPRNVVAILELIRRNTLAHTEAKLTHSELSSTERLRVAALERQGVHKDGRVVWIEECGRGRGWRYLGRERY